MTVVDNVAHTMQYREEDEDARQANIASFRTKVADQAAKHAHPFSTSSEYSIHYTV